MSVGVEIVSPNSARVSRRLRRMALGVRQQKAAFTDIADEMERIIDATFKSQGRRGGGSWRHVTHEWADRKRRERLDPRIMYATHRLINSLTKKNNKEHIRRVTQSSATVGSRVPYASAAGRTRPYMRFTKHDANNLAAILNRHIMAGYRGR